MMWGITIYHCWICYWNVHHLRENKGEKKEYEDAGKGLYNMIFTCPEKHCKHHDPLVLLLAVFAYPCIIMTDAAEVCRAKSWFYVGLSGDKHRGFLTPSHSWVVSTLSCTNPEWQNNTKHAGEKKNNMYRFHEFPALKYVCQKSRHSPG